MGFYRKVSPHSEVIKAEGTRAQAIYRLRVRSICCFWAAGLRIRLTSHEQEHQEERVNSKGSTQRLSVNTGLV